ncbi:hypothetical protein GGR56DRAFT_642192 [Xylariaceae sp. FL0804]|nr:hypothetical protein GGR56DRAFT_642192 [Xylariaceae sp. FL0804]
MSNSPSLGEQLDWIGLDWIGLGLGLGGMCHGRFDVFLCFFFSVLFFSALPPSRLWIIPPFVRTALLRVCDTPPPPPILILIIITVTVLNAAVVVACYYHCAPHSWLMLVLHIHTHTPISQP